MNLDFQDIFNELLNILPSGWENAIFMAEYTSGSYSMRCYSKESNNNYIANVFFTSLHYITNILSTAQKNILYYLQNIFLLPLFQIFQYIFFMTVKIKIRAKFYVFI